MKKKLCNSLLLVLAVLVMLAGAGCSGNKIKITSEIKMQATRLAQDFANELQSFILPQRENEKKLTGLGLAVAKQNETLNFQVVQDFYEEYEKGQDTMVTFAFSTSSFVVTRIAIQDGVGYYMRYQYDPDEETPVVKGSRVFKTVDLKVNEARGIATLDLSNGEGSIATFTLKNIFPDSAEE